MEVLLKILKEVYCGKGCQFSLCVPVEWSQYSHVFQATEAHSGLDLMMMMMTTKMTTMVTDNIHLSHMCM
jgi:hypothetical protein